MSNCIEILLTANTTLLLNNHNDKIIIKYETIYNHDVQSTHTIKTIKELKSKIKQILC